MPSQGRISWIKLWIAECLEGSIRFDLTPEQRSVWYDLLLLAGKSRTAGLISQDGQTPYPNQYIAGMLNIPLTLLEQAVEKFQATGRIEVTSQGIRITNWDKYQSEYQRQKKYRTQQPSQDPEKYKGGKYGHMVKH